MSEPRIIRWGIAGPGRIANSEAADFDLVPDAELAAVGSRSIDRARAFADRHLIPRAYGSYRELIADTELDAIYITTPHPQHLAIARAAIRAGKAVLVEKTFTATVAGAEELRELSRSQRVFAMEAMWTRFLPAYVKIRELIADKVIGDVRQVQADLGVDRPYDPTDRLFDPRQGGGALLDLGVYLVSFAQHILGDPQSILINGSLGPTGVDAEFGLLLGYHDGRAAALLGSIKNASPGAARIVGTGGWIDIPPRFHHPDKITLCRAGKEPELINCQPLGHGYPHQFIEVGNRIRAGQIESPIMSLDDTVAVQRILNNAAEQLGVLHAEDESVLD
ncbi:Gfo/Idh/MocA family oxidoreductase [Microlunatus elymi]|uniref:Gfo/Idh/MocA family oxidoreductase n=1 Tax=Microlunatus elymi TaxID=2596828 RepID=A0A516PVT1_9ACTN|nr:Gfo/Idh/MocA family oxidoreductase [Microlunatus elymi]QDP95061.1 Gfo/Idh/MocA family oxidoreductase [Microlunatus elymi]